MYIGAIGRRPGPLRITAAAKRSSVYVAPPSNSFDFTVMSTQDPLNVGSTWTNNTQGTGGNVAMNAQSSMRVIAAASGGINIAAGDSNGQDAPFDYMDSFAFLPGFSGNQRITATLYIDSGYVPSDTHEIELILGCSTTSGLHTWVECGWGITEGRFMALFNNAAPSGFEILSPTDSGSLNRDPQTNDVWVAELNRSAGTIVTKLNGTQILSITDGRFSSVLGNGAGIAAFRRTSGGTSAANRLGFKSVLIETF